MIYNVYNSDDQGGVDASAYQPASQRGMSNSNMMPGVVPQQISFPSISQISDFEGTGTRQLTDQRMPETLTNPIYVPAYLKKNIGKWVRLEMLIGSSLVSRVGLLLEVGASFVTLQTVSDAVMLCDIYSIKFVTIVDNFDRRALMTLE